MAIFLDDKKSNSIPILRSPPQLLELGPGGTNVQAATPVHPVQLIQMQAEPRRVETQKALMARIYGAHVPMRMTMEETILSQFQRMPGLPSSMVGLETLLNTDTKIDYADYLGGPELSEKQVDVHALIEARLGDRPPRLFH